MNRIGCTNRNLELPCVWSLAGVLEMHPCDREYDCDSCELYHALSGGPAIDDESSIRCPNLSQIQKRLEADVGQIVSSMMAGCRLDFGRWYGGDGVWVRTTGESTDLDVGLVGCVWRILEPVEEIVPPRTGVSFEAGETCGWLLRSERAIPIRLPVGGTVTEVNEPHVAEIGTSGHVDGRDNWLFRVRSALEPPEVPRLFRGEDALIWHLRRLRILKSHIRGALDADRNLVGALMADGGEPQSNLERILGPDRFAAMIDALF
ncbi:MAG: hypothetical protein P8125_05150 [Gemmatimonadota bacterium]|jgi:glycine cleavage system H lipoate-binding protein